MFHKCSYLELKQSFHHPRLCLYQGADSSWNFFLIKYFYQLSQHCTALHWEHSPELRRKAARLVDISCEIFSYFNFANHKKFPRLTLL